MTTDTSDTVYVTLPAWPPDSSIRGGDTAALTNHVDGKFPPLDHYQVRLAGFDGTRTFSVPSGGSIMAEADKGEVIAVVVQPVTRHGEKLAEFFRPAGCVLPNTSEATWAGGFATYVCEDLMYNTSGVSSSAVSATLANFNWARFTQTVEAKCIDTKGEDGAAVVCDPWTLDTKRICSKILSKDFTARDITPTTAKDKRAIKDTSDLIARSGLSGNALFPRYVPAYLQQHSNGKVRLLSDKYAEGINLKSANIFLCAQDIVIFSVAINSKYAATVEPLVMPLRGDVLDIYGIAP